jgi:NADH-quinone oxidoreductase subunit G
MTVSAERTGDVEKREDLVSLTIDGVEVSVPKGTLVIRAAEQIGVQIPRFCDHPLLDPVGACRQCLVEVPDMGNGRGMPKPQASCTLPVAEGMVVNTQATSPVADKAQQGIMEFLLINHPLDCPMCDKGGECQLHNQAKSNRRGESRNVEQKRTYPKPINISAQVLLDRERCILCARCTRFSEQIAGDPFIEMIERGALQQVGIYEQEPFESYFSGNTIQICPVGALTSASYRFRSRPFDLVSVSSVCEHCASGCELRTDIRRGKVMRRLAGFEPEVNEEWNCDKGRFAFTYPRQPDRLTHPLVRDEDTHELRPASWPEAFAVAARGLQAALRDASSLGSSGTTGGVGVLTGGRLTAEDAYAYSKFARVALDTNDIDFRSREHSAEEMEFLAARIAGTSLGATYRDLEKAGKVLLVGFEPEEESPIVFLRLRKAARKHGTRVFSVAPYTSRGLQKMRGTLLRTAPGQETAVLDDLARDASAALGSALDGSDVILVGERMATVPGALSGAAALADATGARLAWVPRRAGDRGAVEAGCLPNVLPGGRPVEDAAARVDVGTVWGTTVPHAPGRDTSAIVAAAAAGELKGLVVAGVQLADLPDPALAAEAVRAAGFVVSLEIRASEVTEHADVVFPVAPVTDKAGTFLDWEGRQRPFEAVFRVTRALPDLRVLSGIADELDAPLGFRTVDQVRAEMAELEAWDGARVELAGHTAAPQQEPETTGAADPALDVVLATWKLLIDDGRMLDGEEFLQATGRRPVALVSAATLARLGVLEGNQVTITGPRGSVDLPVAVADLPDGVAWAPTSSGGMHMSRDLGVGAGSVVRLAGRDLDPRPEPAGSEGGAA